MQGTPGHTIENMGPGGVNRNSDHLTDRDRGPTAEPGDQATSIDANGDKCIPAGTFDRADRPGKARPIRVGIPSRVTDVLGS